MGIRAGQEKPSRRQPPGTRGVGYNEAPRFLGAYSLVDEKSGKAIDMALWETEEAMVSSIEPANRLRQEASDEAGRKEKPAYEM